MQGRIVTFLLGSVLTFSALAVGSPTAWATVVFDDHFTGDSGGIPTGWSQIYGTGTAVESGTTVTLNGGIIIATDSVFDPNEGVVTLTHLLLVEFHPSDLRLAVSASSTGGESWQSYEATTLTGYAHGPLRLTLDLRATSFSVSSDSPPFSSGFIAYSTAFPGFTRVDLGDTCNLVISHDPSAGLGSSSIDRATLEVEPETAVQSCTFGQVKALYRP